jgi:hypothetical protein
MLFDTLSGTTGGGQYSLQLLTEHGHYKEEQLLAYCEEATRTFNKLVEGDWVLLDSDPEKNDAGSSRLLPKVLVANNEVRTLFNTYIIFILTILLCT